jgi:hypothetical protein
MLAQQNIRFDHFNILSEKHFRGIAAESFKASVNIV